MMLVFNVWIICMKSFYFIQLIWIPNEHENMKGMGWQGLCLKKWKALKCFLLISRGSKGKTRLKKHTRKQIPLETDDLISPSLWRRRRTYIKRKKGVELHWCLFTRYLSTYYWNVFTFTAATIRRRTSFWIRSLFMLVWSTRITWITAFMLYILHLIILSLQILVFVKF